MYDIVFSSDNVNEEDSFNAVIKTNNVPEGTFIYWKVSNTTNSLVPNQEGIYGYVQANESESVTTSISG